MTIAPKSFVSIVGVSGSGKSTIAGILMGKNPKYRGSLKINKTSIVNLHAKQYSLILLW